MDLLLQSMKRKMMEKMEKKRENYRWSTIAQFVWQSFWLLLTRDSAQPSVYFLTLDIIEMFLTRITEAKRQEILTSIKSIRVVALASLCLAHKLLTDIVVCDFSDVREAYSYDSELLRAAEKQIAEVCDYFSEDWLNTLPWRDCEATRWSSKGGNAVKIAVLRHCCSREGGSWRPHPFSKQDFIDAIGDDSTLRVKLITCRCIPVELEMWKNRRCRAVLSRAVYGLEPELVSADTTLRDIVMIQEARKKAKTVSSLFALKIPIKFA
jgi:hypothetical protein